MNEPRSQWGAVPRLPTACTRAPSAREFSTRQDAGLPLHRFPLARTAQAHAAVENQTVGKVLIDVAAAA